MIHSAPSAAHIPVLLDAIVSGLHPTSDGIYVDATFGRGGYTRALFNAGAGHVIALDQDPEAADDARRLCIASPQRFDFVPGNFECLESLVRRITPAPITGVIFDLGVSSPQLDTPERGFSFSKDGPLDMRMSLHGQTAAQVLNTFSGQDLADIFYYYGEEKKSRAIAAAIVERRTSAPLTRTQELRHLIHRIVGPRSGRIDSATRTFQALRLFVNNELGVLPKGLEQAVSVLMPGGILGVVSFHSLEDRLVKTFMKEHPLLEKAPTPRVMPSDAECQHNPRARSARLRWALKKTASSRETGAAHAP